MKDKITNICGIIVAIGTGLLTAHASNQIVLPDSFLLAVGSIVAVATGLIGYFTGKPAGK